MESVSSARLAGGHMHQRPVRTLLGRASPESGGWTRLLWVFLWQCLSWLLWGVRMKQSASILPQKFFAIRSPGITAEREETGSWHCKFSTLLRELTEERSTERTASAIFRKWIKASNFHSLLHYHDLLLPSCDWKQTSRHAFDQTLLRQFVKPLPFFSFSLRQNESPFIQKIQLGLLWLFSVANACFWSLNLICSIDISGCNAQTKRKWIWLILDLCAWYFICDILLL